MKAVWYDDIEKLKKVAQDGEGRSAKMVVWRKVKMDNTKFSAFLEALFGTEHDREAVLAHAAPAVTITSRFLEQLLAGMCLSDVCGAYTDYRSNHIHHADPRGGSPPGGYVICTFLCTSL